MSLFEASAHWMYANASMVGIVVHRIRLNFHAFSAEIYLTILFHTWVFDGTGLTYAWPGAGIKTSENAALVGESRLPKSVHTCEHHFGIMQAAMVVGRRTAGRTA